MTLKDVKEISNPSAPLKDQLFIASTNIDIWTSGPADAKAPNGNADSKLRTLILPSTAVDFLLRFQDGHGYQSEGAG